MELVSESQVSPSIKQAQGVSSEDTLECTINVDSSCQKYD